MDGPAKISEQRQLAAILDHLYAIGGESS